MYRRSVEEMEKDDADKLIVDLREREAYEKETYPGAIHIDGEAFWEHVEELPSDRPVYLICYTGQRSDELAEELAARGWDKVFSVEGGYRGYLRVKLSRMMRSGRSEDLRSEKDERSQELIQKDSPPFEDLTEWNRYVEKSIVKKFKKEIWRGFTKAINAYDMISDGDRIAVCISGGKDSMLMAKLFQELERHGRKNFDVVFLVMNPGYNERNYERICDNANLLQIPISVFQTEIFDTVADIKDNPCYLCARMRRGYLYSEARKRGCNKIALGHHFDDVIETIVMGMLYGAQIQTMMPKLHSTNFLGMELIRPLYLIREKDIIHWSEYNRLHFIQCACRFTESCASCGGTERGSKRAEVKRLIRVLEEENPYVAKNIFRSVENVNLDTIIAYKKSGLRHHFLEDYEG